MLKPFKNVNATRVQYFRIVLGAVTVAVSTSFGYSQQLLGVSVGVMDFELRARKGEGHQIAKFEPSHGAFPTATVFFRDKRLTHFNWCFEAIYSRKEFSAYYSSGSLAGSKGAEGEVVLDLIHLSILPQVKLGPKGRTSIRFGFMHGVIIKSYFTGREWNSYPYQWSSRELHAEPAEDFVGDLRFLIGFGVELPAGEGMVITIDPYWSPAVGPLLARQPYSFGQEWGIRLGCGRMMRNRKSSTPVKPSTGDRK